MCKYCDRLVVPAECKEGCVVGDSPASLPFLRALEDGRIVYTIDVVDARTAKPALFYVVPCAVHVHLFMEG